MLSLLALLRSETGVTRMLAPQRAAGQGIRQNGLAGRRWVFEGGAAPEPTCL